MKNTRRAFLQSAATIAGATTAPTSAEPVKNRIAVISEIKGEQPVRWAVEELQRVAGPEADQPDIYVIVRRGSLPVEGFRISEGRHLGKRAIEIVASDSLGSVYGLLEIADRFRLGADLFTPTSEAPANRIRSITRAFVSDMEDKPWFYDKDFWREYLTTLASHPIQSSFH